LPGTQLVNRLQDLKYRVLTVSDPETLVKCAEQEKAMLVVADLVSKRGNLCDMIRKLRSHAETQHIPVVAFAPESDSALQDSARAAGATLVVSETAVLDHLAQFLEQALRVD
jgi:PleD family two-component response regulator